MTINQLVKNGLLKKVKVQRPPDAIIEAGNLKASAIFGDRSRNCADNSICVVEVMREQGENDWHIVPGFAFNPECKKPLMHVWVRKGYGHYDPTWILWWNPINLAYYQVLHPLEDEPRGSEIDNLERIVKWGNETLGKLRALAADWKLKLAGQ